jgi:hypothetical protein
MSSLRIPPALDRHLLSAVHTAAATGGVGLGAFDAVVEQIVRALREQGAKPNEVEDAIRDAFAALASPFQRTGTAERYAELAQRALAAAAAAGRPRSAATPIDTPVIRASSRSARH